jgi:hypothetical protein
MKKKAKKEFGEATRASIMKEMAKPRPPMEKSPRKQGKSLKRRRITSVCCGAFGVLVQENDGTTSPFAVANFGIRTNLIN